MYCINCGSQLPDGTKYCLYCGNPLNITGVSVNNSPRYEIQNNQNPNNTKNFSQPYSTISYIKTTKKPFYKRWWFWGIVIVFLLSLFCKKIINTYQPHFSVNSTVSKSESVQKSEVVYSDNDITITMYQPTYTKSYGGAYNLDLNILNNSSNDIYYEVEYLLVNGFQIPQLLFGDVYSEMTANTKITISSDEMELACIDHILNVDVCISLLESNNDKNLIDRPILSIKTPDFEKYEQSYDFSWPVVYDKNGLRILARFGETGESSPVVLFVENNTGKTVSISYHDIAINNTMVCEMISGTQVVNGAKQVTEMNRSLLEMSDNDVPNNKDINSITFKLSFLPINDDGSFSTGNTY